MRWLAGITGLALALIGVMLAAELREGPPPPVDQQAVATRLEPVALLIGDLGVGIWLEDRDCRMLMLDLDETYADPQAGACANEGGPLTPGARSAFYRVAAAVAGTVPGGRVRMVSVAEDHTDAANAGPGEAGNLSDHWRFTERRRNDG